MIGLHARDHAERAEARNVRGREMLRVLDAEPSISRPVLARDALEDVELRADRAIADRVHDHMKSGLVGPDVHR